MRQEFPDLVHHYHQANKLWSGSYFAGFVDRTPLTILTSTSSSNPARIEHSRTWQPSPAGTHPDPEERSTGRKR